MASYYVYSGAAGVADGTSWTDAYTTLAAAISGKAAGDVFYVSDDHSESTASEVTWTFPGTVDNPSIVLCVLRSGGSVPPVAADLRTTGVAASSGNTSIVIGGSFYIYGLNIRCGVSTSQSTRLIAFVSGTTGNPRLQVYDSCVLEQASTGSGARIGNASVGNIGHRAQRVQLINTQIKFGAVGQSIDFVNCDLLWCNTASAIQGSVPTTLFLANSNSEKGALITVRGVDLSALGSGNTLVNVAGTNIDRYRFENCKLGSSVAITTGTLAGIGGPEVSLVNCDSGDTNYRYQITNYAGTISQESTIVRTGGASDGTTPISRKMVSTANSKFYSPLISDPVIVWNDTPGSYTATIEVVTDNVTLTDAEAWAEVEYLGTSGFPLSLFAKDRATNILSTPANQTTSSETWTTTGLATPVKQKLAVAFTTAEKGPVAVRVHLAKASTTMYFCPKVDVT